MKLSKPILFLATILLFISSTVRSAERSAFADLSKFLMAQQDKDLNVCVYGPKVAKTLVPGSTLRVLSETFKDGHVIRVLAYPTYVSGVWIFRKLSESPDAVEGEIQVTWPETIASRPFPITKGTGSVYHKPGAVVLKVGDTDLTVVSLTPTSIIGTADRTVVIISVPGTESCSNKSID
jgi:hypothetical protein